MKRSLLFVSISLLASGSVLAACTGDDNTMPPPVTVDSGTPDTSLPKVDSSVPDSSVGDTNVPDTKVADSNVADTNVADTNVADTNVADTNVADTNIADVAPDTADAACSGSLLTVKNFLNWCSVSVAGGAATTDAVITACVPSDSTVNLSATAASGFILGPAPWHHTNGDNADAGDPGTDVDAGGVTQSNTTVLSSSTGATCVWICCPHTDGSGCNIPDQCP